MVQDQEGQLLHRPPDAHELEARLQALCDFANGSHDTEFLHPVIRAIVLHFWLAYDHPFVDGNGRTARALFYWSMAAQGYWLCEYISISRVLMKSPTQYYRAFLYSEHDDNDATYFILNQLKVVQQAIEDLHAYLSDKSGEMARTEALFGRTLQERFNANARQLALLNHALKHPQFAYTIGAHQRSHGVSYETARVDLLSLADAKLLELRKRGRQFVFISPVNLKTRLTR